MRITCRIWMLLLCLVFLPAMLHAQTRPASVPAPSSQAVIAAVPTATAVLNPKTPEEFFARARQLSDLEASGIPFHLKATFVAAGDAEFTGNGTYEEWWQSKDLWRKEATLEDYKLVEIKNGNDEKSHATWPYVPLRLRQVMDTVLIRIPADAASRKWEMNQKKLSGAEFEVLSSTNLRAQVGEARCITQDYFTMGGVLRIHVEGSAIEYLYNNLQPFQNVLVARNVTDGANGAAILKISIISVEPLSTSEATMLKGAHPPADLQPIPSVVDMKAQVKNNTAKVMASKLLHATQPIYPREAKLQRIEGTVVIEATIDEAGKVREPFVICSAGSLLDQAALDAVRTWRYRPTVFNGVPVGVRTTISVVFTMR